MANIRGITAVILEVTKETGLTVATLPLVVGLNLTTQIDRLIRPILVETSPTRIIWSITTEKTGAPHIHAGA